MKKGRFNDAQIMAVSKHAESGVPVSWLCREHGMSSASCCKWRAKFGSVHCTAVYRVAMSRERMCLSSLR
jgi:putative transposase